MKEPYTFGRPPEFELQIFLEAAKKYDYEPETGLFRLKNGKIRGTKDPKGYIKLTARLFDRQHQIYAHRLAWWLVHRSLPKCQIDHENGIKDDNRIDNLREATPGQNNWNRGIQSTNKSGFKGIAKTPLKKRDEWFYTIYANGGTYRQFGFHSPEAANEACIARRAELHKDFARSE